MVGLQAERLTVKVHMKFLCRPNYGEALCFNCEVGSLTRETPSASVGHGSRRLSCRCEETAPTLLEETSVRNKRCLLKSGAFSIALR